MELECGNPDEAAALVGLAGVVPPGDTRCLAIEALYYAAVAAQAGRTNEARRYLDRTERHLHPTAANLFLRRWIAELTARLR